MSERLRRCPMVDEHGAACSREVDERAPVALCDNHLSVAYDWAASTLAVDDTLESPCVACGSRLGVRYPSGWLCAVCEWKVGDHPDGELAPPRVDVVYYIRFDDRIKIGTTANPRQRLGRLWHDQLLAFERGDRRTERRRHEQFAEHRLGSSEWFAVHPALDRHIDVVAAGTTEPWDLYSRWVSEAYALRG